MTVKRNLLLLSNSTLHPTGYLEYAADHIQQFLRGCGVNEVQTLLKLDLSISMNLSCCKLWTMTSLQVLFVPYALRKQDEYAATARKAFEAWGFSFSSIHTAENPYLAASQAQVGGQ